MGAKHEALGMKHCLVFVLMFLFLGRPRPVCCLPLGCPQPAPCLSLACARPALLPVPMSALHCKSTQSYNGTRSCNLAAHALGALPHATYSRSQQLRPQSLHALSSSCNLAKTGIPARTPGLQEHLRQRLVLRLVPSTSRLKAPHCSSKARPCPREPSACYPLQPRQLAPNVGE